jgi:hypothetical protein
MHKRSLLSEQPTYKHRLKSDEFKSAGLQEKHSVET